MLYVYCTEWRGAEEVCSGVSGQSQAGGAAIPDTENPRWGETRQVRRGWQEILLSSQVRSNKLNSFTLNMCLTWCLSRRANEEIAQVRAKANSDNMALTAGLRKEQMKNESLEQALQQKVPAFFFLSPCKLIQKWASKRTQYNTSSVFLRCYDELWPSVNEAHLLHLFLSCHRTERLRNSPRSATSWLPKWGK